MSFIELFERFALLIFSIFLLYFLATKFFKVALNPLMLVVGVCTFSLCYVFTKSDIGIGIGFGLFSIFSILRFRTELFSIDTIIFLFVTITLSIVDVLYPIEKYDFLIFFQAIIVVIYLLVLTINKKELGNSKQSFGFKIPFNSGYLSNQNFLRQAIQEQTKLQNFDFKIIKINTTINEIELLISI